MSDTPVTGTSTPAAPAASPTPAPQGNAFNPHTTVRSVVPSSGQYPDDPDSYRAQQKELSLKAEAQKVLGTEGAVEEPDPTAPRHTTQPRDEKGRWTAEEIQAAADEGYDVEGLEPGMEHPDEEPVEEDAPPQTIRIKVHGEEMEVDLATAKAELEMNFGAKKLFSKLDQERREFLAAKEQAAQRPEAFLEHAGHDPEKWAVDFLNRKIAMAQMSPQERELYDRHEAVRAREEQIAAYEAQQERAAKEQRDAATLQMLSAELPRQLQAVGLPADGSALSLILPHLKDVEAAGLDITPEHVQRAAQLARQTLDVGVVRTIREMRGPQLIQALGPEVLQEVRRLDLEAARARKLRGAPAPKKEAEATPPQARPKVMMTEAEFREYQKRRGL